MSNTPDTSSAPSPLEPTHDAEADSVPAPPAADQPAPPEPPPIEVLATIPSISPHPTTHRAFEADGLWIR